MELVRKEGNRTVKRKVEFYNLDAIISVGFRVNTKRGIEFRQWANQVLKDYLLSTEVPDPAVLKNKLVFRYFSYKFQKINLSLHHETKILMMTTTNTATLDESKLVVRDMTPEELYAVIEQDIKAIYEADDVI